MMMQPLQQRDEKFEMQFSAGNPNLLGVLSQRDLQLFELVGPNQSNGASANGAGYNPFEQGTRNGVVNQY